MESKRAQGAFEYILMVAGVIMIVILVILITQGTVTTINNTLSNNLNQYSTIVNVTCLLGGC